MAFQTRCPECDAKLKFDEAPDADEAIECPRCGHVYDAADAKPVVKKRAKALVGVGGGDDKPRKKKPAAKTGVPRKRKVKVKKTNLVFLYAMLGAALVVAPFIGWVGYKLFWSTGKIGNLMAYVPPESNLMRGVDIERLGKTPGYKDQLTAAMDGGFNDCRTDLAKAAGSDVETFLDYAMCAKIKNGANSGMMYVFQSMKPFNATTLATALGGKVETVDGQEVRRLGARTGPMNNAIVYVPTDRIVVVVASDGDQSKMLKASIAAKALPKESNTWTRIGETGRKVSRAHVWTLMRPDGDLKNAVKEQIADPLKQSMSTLSQKVASAKMFGTYMYFGSKIKYGAAIECESDSSAEGLAKTMKDGPLSKGDDSEIPRDLQMLFPVSRIRDFTEFMSDLQFLSQGSMAFLEAKMSLAKSVQVLPYFNRTDMWDAKPQTGGGLGRH